MSLEDDNSGITDELLAELREVKEELKKIREEKKIHKLSFWIGILSTEPLKITGIALSEGEWNGVLYKDEELKKAINQLKGIPLRVEHGRSEQYKDRQVGKITQCIYDDLLKALKFEAVVEDTDAVKDILKKRFQAVSMSTLMNYKPVNGHVMGTDFEFLECSLVENPACENCQIFSYEQALSKLGIKDISKENIINGEVNIMPKEKIYLASEELTLDLDIDVELELLNKFGEIVGFKFTNKEELETEDEETKAKRKKYRYYWRYNYYPYSGYPIKTSLEEDEELKVLVTRIIEEYLNEKKEEKPEEKTEEETPEEPEEEEGKEEKEEDLSFLDEMPLASEYTDFIKKCVKEGGDFKSCAKKWKAEKKTEEEKTEEVPAEVSEETPVEEAEETPAEVPVETPTEELKEKCPYCDFEGTDEEVKKHIAEKHPDKYSEKYPEAKTEEEEKEMPTETPEEETSTEEKVEEEKTEEEKTKEEQLSKMKGEEAVWTMVKFLEKKRKGEK